MNSDLKKILLLIASAILASFGGKAAAEDEAADTPAPTGKEKTKPKPKAKPAAEEEEEDDGKITKESLKALATPLAEAGKGAQLVKIAKRYGADKLSEVDEKHYPKVKEDIEALLEML